MLTNDDKNLLIKTFSKFDLNEDDLKLVNQNASYIKCQKGQILYPNTGICHGFVIIKKGKLRAFVESNLGKEITIFNLNLGDECVLCASCMSQNLHFEINLEAKEDLEMILIKPEIFSLLRQKYQKLSNYALELISKRFALSVNAMQEALFTPLNQRIWDFLVKNASFGILKITHEDIAKELGTAREAVSRILKDMEKQGQITLCRGKIIIKQ